MTAIFIRIFRNRPVKLTVEQAVKQTEDRGVNDLLSRDFMKINTCVIFSSCVYRQ